MRRLEDVPRYEAIEAGNVLDRLNGKGCRPALSPPAFCIQLPPVVLNHVRGREGNAGRNEHATTPSERFLVTTARDDCQNHFEGTESVRNTLKIGFHAGAPVALKYPPT